MGVYVCVQDRFGDVDGWTWGLAGDRQMARLMCDLPHEYNKSDQHMHDCFRPTDFAAWRVAIPELAPEPNEGRFAELIDLLEANPDFWIFISW